jgi:hypothetical protein
MRRIFNYLTEHRHRMRYAQLRRDDLDIGTGAVEGAVRNLVGLRLDGPGMRWGRDRSEMILPASLETTSSLLPDRFLHAHKAPRHRLRPT